MKNSIFSGAVFCAFFVFFLSVTGFADQATLEDVYKASRVEVPVMGKILIITEEGFNDTELLYPYYRFVEEGFEVTIATLYGGEVAGYNTAPVKNTVPVTEINADEYAGLYLPGGHAPAVLKEDQAVLSIVESFITAGKPIAAICHGPQILAKTGVLEGREVAAWPGIEEEMTDAGAYFKNQPVVVDGNIATARMPGDLPPHVHVFLSMFE